MYGQKHITTLTYWSILYGQLLAQDPDHASTVRATPGGRSQGPVLRPGHRSRARALRLLRQLIVRWMHEQIPRRPRLRRRSPRPLPGRQAPRHPCRPRVAAGASASGAEHRLGSVIGLPQQGDGWTPSWWLVQDRPCVGLRNPRCPQNTCGGCAAPLRPRSGRRCDEPQRSAPDPR